MVNSRKKTTFAPVITKTKNNMKRIFILMAVLACITLSATAQSLGVYINDNNGKYTNIRNAPNGKVVFKLKLPNANGTMFAVDRVVNGWWHIDGTEYSNGDEEGEFTGSTTGYWIHNSVITVDTRNYGGQKLSLRSKPSAKASVVFSFKKEISLIPLDIKGDWVKVKTADGKHTGWIEREWLCGNSLTNCC